MTIDFNAIRQAILREGGPSLEGAGVLQGNSGVERGEAMGFQIEAQPDAAAAQIQERTPVVVVQGSDTIRVDSVMMLVDETEKWKQLAQEQAAEQEAKKQQRKRKAR